MAISFSLIILILAVTTTSTVTTIHSANKTHPHSRPTTPPPSLPPEPAETQETHPHSRPTTPPPSPPPGPAETQEIHPHSRPTTPPPSTPPAPARTRETHIDNIIDALIGSGDFSGWANLLSSADPSALPLTATFFIPENNVVSNQSDGGGADNSFDGGFLIAYHIVPQRLTFADLQKLVVRTRLPTLLPAKYIVVTDSSPANFSVDGSKITRPDVFVNAAFAVHGVREVLKNSVYGGAPVPPPTMPSGASSGLAANAPAEKGATSGPPEKRNSFFTGGISLTSGGSGLCGWVLMIFSISCAVLVIFLIH